MASSSVAAAQSYLGAQTFNKLYYNGGFVAPLAGETFETLYPATGEVVHAFPRGRAVDVNAAIDAAVAAWQDGAWAALTAVQRAVVVRKMVDGIGENLDMLATLEAAEVGKSFLDARSALAGIVGEGHWWCNQAVQMDAEQDLPVDGVPADVEVVYRRDPVGIVGLVTAWNYPVNVAFRKVAPALIAGNCAILKPSEFACLSCMFLAQLAQDAGIPAGVFSVIAGDRDAGEALVSNPAVSMVSFTGSSATGSKIMTSCAPRLAQTMLELGGKSALVMYGDVQLEAAVEATMRGFLTNGGQICTAHSRLIVHEDIKDALLTRLKKEIEELPFCDDPIADRERGDNAWVNEKPTVLQPVICKSQHDKIGSMLDAAKSRGITVLCGGSLVDRPGYYVQPTIFVDPPRSDPIWQQEIFGPVLSVRTFRTDQEAVAEANSTAFGLASTVMCADAVRCRRVANQVRAGAVYATSNGKGILFEFPMVQRGGYGQSGVGRELGLHGLYEYTELKSVNFTGFRLEDAISEGEPAAKVAKMQ